MPGEHESERSQVFAIDVVHKDFLGDYIDRHAVPFAEQFAELAIKHHNVLADARGFVPGMRKEWRSNFETRLKTAGVIAAGKRVRASFRSNKKGKA
jgi:hypothetical protein